MKKTTISNKLDLIQQLHDMFADAVQLSCGNTYYDIYQSMKDAIRVTSNWQNKGDFHTVCAKKFYRIHEAKSRKKSMCISAEVNTSSNSSSSSVSPIEVITVSDLGFERKRSYSSPKQMAKSIIECLDERKRSTILSNIFIDEIGGITITTKFHLDWHTIMGRQYCSLCGFYYKGGRGLRIHQVNKHGRGYSEAQRDALDSESQLIVYSADEISISRWLVEAKTILNKMSSLCDPGLTAARDGDLETLKKLVILNEWDPIKSEDRNGCNALHWAAGEGHVEICKFLVEECKFDINELRGRMKRHAIHWAARNGRRNIIEWMVKDKGVDINVQTADGTASIHLAAYTGEIDTCIWMIDEMKCDIHILNSFGCNASQWVAINGSIPLMKFFLHRGLDFTIFNKNGHSAIHKAAIKGNINTCRWLLKEIIEGGAGLGMVHCRKDREGNSPSTLAKENGFEKLAEYLSHFEESSIL